MNLLFIACLLAAPADKGDFVPLFNGKNLDGWEQRNGTATYRVDGDCVVGKTSEGSPNSFLCTTKEYGDFELKFEVKLMNKELNSGVQIRSKSKGDTKEGRVHGPQVEISTDGKAGYVYGEGLTTGWLAIKAPKSTEAFKNSDWNEYRVVAQGKSIKTWINGTLIADITENETGMMKGFIGLQVHGIAKGTGPYEVRWRNIVIREIK